MQPATRRALNRINARFYREQARAFSDTRRKPWPGWEQLLPHLTARVSGAAPLRVLDVGCGNGRFGAFLAARWSGPVACTGVDASEALLDEARARDPAGDYRRLDLVEEPAEALPAGPFDLAAVFGVLHHVPGSEARRDLVRALLGRLAPRGALAISVWRFADLPRFRRRVLAWEEYLAGAPETGLAADALEPADVLLPWGRAGAGEAVRYFHLLDADELETLRGAAGAHEAARFETERDGGGGNLYVLWEPGNAAAA